MMVDFMCFEWSDPSYKFIMAQLNSILSLLVSWAIVLTRQSIESSQ